MARVTYERGLKCKRCGRMYISIDRFQRCIVCQDCGAHIANFDRRNKEAEITKNADVITVKVTHKLFTDICEEVLPYETTQTPMLRLHLL